MIYFTRILKQLLRSMIIKKTSFSQLIIKKSSRLKGNKTIKENIVKDVPSIFQLKKLKKQMMSQLKVKYIFFWLKKDNEAIKDRILRDNRNPFEHKGEENYHKPVTLGNFWSNKYNKCKSNSGRNMTLSAKEYLNKIKPYLNDITNDLKLSDPWKIKVTIVVKLIYFKGNDEERVMHSKIDNIKIMINDKTFKVTEELFI